MHKRDITSVRFPVVPTVTLPLQIIKFIGLNCARRQSKKSDSLLSYYTRIYIVHTHRCIMAS